MIRECKMINVVLLLLLSLRCVVTVERKDTVPQTVFDTVSVAVEYPERVITREDSTKQKLRTTYEFWVAEHVDKDFLTGRTRRQNNPLFVQVGKEHTDRNIFLIHPVYEAYKKMFKAALADNIKLKITSGHRVFWEQVSEWELRWNNPRTEITFRDEVEKAKFVLQYRAMPGTTRHHWGTDIDLNSFELAYWETNTGKTVYSWLKENAGNFGFFQPYTAYDDKRPCGYMEEKWHWSYKPLSRFMLAKYLELVSIDDITGFKGDAAAKKLPIIAEWVCGINPRLYDEE